MKKSKIVLLTMFLSLLLVVNVFAATFNVSTTAQFRKALEDAAVNGEDDTIVLEAGTYKVSDDGAGTFSFFDSEAHNLTIKAKDGLTADDVILDGTNTAQVLHFKNTKDSTLIVERVSIINGYHNKPSTDNGGGIEIFNNLILLNSKVKNNRAYFDGGGLWVAGTLLVRNSEVSNNYTSYGIGGINAVWNPAIIVNSIISDNQGGGFSCNVSSAIINSTIVNNATRGHGIFVNNIFSGNSSFSGDGSLYNNYIDYTKIDVSSFNTIVNKNIIPPSAGDLNFSDTQFRLNAGSVAIDKGLDPNSDTFKNLFADSTMFNTVLGALYTDKDGNSRIAGSAIDLGAYEYGSSPAPPIFTLTVNKSAANGMITSSPVGISCGSDCIERFQPGTLVTLTATPSSGYAVVWSGACTGTSTTCTLTMDADKAVTITFKQFYTLSVTLSGTGSGTVSATGLTCSGKTCTATYDSGVSAALTATPASGSTFTGWSGGWCAGSGACVISMYDNISVTATFTASSTSSTQYALTVTKSGSGDVSASAGSIIWSSNTGTVNYNSATQLTLTATASSGYTFTGWSGACSGTGTCSITMSAAKAVTATFTASGTSGGTTGGDDTTQYTLTVTKSGSGDVSASAGSIIWSSNTGTAHYSNGAVVTLTAIVGSGYTFTGWSGDCSGSGTCSVTMSAAKAVTATFNKTQGSNSTCTNTVSSTKKTVTASSSTGFVSIATKSACTWTASSDSDWLTITSSSSGTGRGRINYSILANTSTNSRTGKITIESKTFTVTQKGMVCKITSVSKTKNSFTNITGTDSFDVVIPTGCGWTATTAAKATWITITSGNGTGNGTVSYSVAANSSKKSRTSKITIATTSNPINKKLFAVIQAK